MAEPWLFWRIAMAEPWLKNSHGRAMAKMFLHRVGLQLQELCIMHIS